MKFRNVFKKDENGKWNRKCIKVYDTWDLVQKTLNNYNNIIINPINNSTYNITITRSRTTQLLKLSVHGYLESHQITLSIPNYNTNIIKYQQIHQLLSLLSKTIHSSQEIKQSKHYTFNIQVEF